MNLRYLFVAAIVVMSTHSSIAQGFENAIGAAKKSAAQNTNSNQQKTSPKQKTTTTDFAEAKRIIISEMSEWQKKGEFEKSADYEKRLKEQSVIIFDSLAIDATKSVVYYVTNWYCQPVSYDADKELYTMNFINANQSLTYTKQIPISVEDAKKIKAIADRYPPKTTDYHSIEKEIVLYFNDWASIRMSNGYFVLPEMTLGFKRDDSRIRMPNLNIPNLKQVVYNFDELGLNNPYLKGHSLNFSQAMMQIAIEKEIQKQRADSIEREDRKKVYNTYLDLLHSSYNGYQRDLSRNSYNIDSIKMPDIEFNLDENNIEQSYNFLNNKVETTYKDLKKKIQNKHDECWRQNQKFFSSQSDFDIYYYQGLEKLQDEIEHRQDMQFLKQNNHRIAAIDFKKPASNSVGKDLLNLAVGNDIDHTDYSDINTFRTDLINFVNKRKDRVYYSEIIDFLFENNYEMKLEFTKNGSYFGFNKSDFFDAYSSGNYKTILKSKK